MKTGRGAARLVQSLSCNKLKGAGGLAATLPH